MRRHGEAATRGCLADRNCVSGRYGIFGFLRVPVSPLPRVPVSPLLRVSASPRPRVSASPRPRVPASPCPRVSPSPRLPVPASPCLPISVSAIHRLDLYLNHPVFNHHAISLDWFAHGQTLSVAHIELPTVQAALNHMSAKITFG
jgi:hypothetical protein